MTIKGITPEEAQRMTDAVLAIAPEMQGAMDDIRRQAKDEQEAAILLMKWCEDHPEVVERMTAKFLAPLDTQQKPQRVESPLPALLAKERAQFDGDVPEYREGPLTEGMTPAIPVYTVARNPVQIGIELEQVATKVKQEAQALLLQWQEMVQGTTGTDMVISDQPPDPASYPAGKPAEMAVPNEVSTADLLVLSPEQRQRYTWKMISTTQGRRSALSVVGNLVAERLGKSGFDCPVRDFDHHRRVEVLAHASWSYTLTGRADLQPQFSFIDVAAQTIAEILSAKGVQGWLEVTAIDSVDIRKVGWACRIVKDT